MTTATAAILFQYLLLFCHWLFILYHFIIIPTIITFVFHRRTKESRRVEAGHAFVTRGRPKSQVKKFERESLSWGLEILGDS